MPATQLGVGRDGQWAGGLGVLLPLGPVVHGLGEGFLLRPVAVAHRPVAGGPELVPVGALVIAVFAGRRCLCVGAGRIPVGLVRADADQPQLSPDVPGCPVGLGGVGVADEPQAPVGHGADVRPVDWAEGEEGFVPCGALVGGVVGGFGADRVPWVVVAVHLAVGSDR